MAKTTTQFIIYDTDSGALYYDADGNTTDGIAAVQFATLTNLPSGLTNADFILV